jgi:beta-glucosidase
MKARRAVAWALSVVLAAPLAAVAQATQPAATQQPTISAREVPVISVQGLRFKDLNRTGQLDPYEDWRLPPGQRAADVTARMTLAEKVGTMMHSTLPGRGGTIGRSNEGYDLAAAGTLIRQKHVSSFITRLALTASRFAEENNRVQALAESTRLGIPISISSDPRNHFQYVLGASESGAGFSQWPEPLGLAAIGDSELVRRFGDVARQEYRAVGIHIALSPQADLATEPRWPRATGTFGSDAATVSRLIAAYVEGFQNGRSSLGPQSVATVVKHWVGYGAQPDGFDAHNYYGRFARLDNEQFAVHVSAFEGAFRANVAGVMPAYPIIQGVTLEGKPLEPVGPGFSRQLLTDLLRGRYAFSGIILSDWAITRDCDSLCSSPTADQPQPLRSIATPWGVEQLTSQQRFVKGVLAGLDQFGGTDEVEPLLAAVNSGQVAEQRIDESVRRILRQKFELGLFENPYVDPAQAARIVGSPQFQRAADSAQRSAQVLLENKGMLPMQPKQKKLYLHGVDATLAAEYGFKAVADPKDADIAIVRATAPSEKLHPYHFFGSRQNEGRLEFRDGDPDYEAIKGASAHVPTIVCVYLDRPAILANIKDRAAALIANFGANDRAILDVITGRAKPEGKLPFELPSSMAAVGAQAPGAADDSLAPLYKRGAGLKFTE